MFKWLGLILGGLFATHYFSLIPENLYDWAPNVNEVIDVAEGIDMDEFGTDAVNTIAQGQAVVENIVEEIVEEATQQSQPVVQVIEQLTEQQVQSELPRVNQQFTIWQPFSSHYSAQGMAQSLTASTGVAVDVVQQGSDYVLMVSYQSEAERLSLIEQLKTVLGNEVAL